MNVASLELCRELFELTGWYVTQRRWAYYTDVSGHEHSHTYDDDYESALWSGDCPAYALGELLRQLQQRPVITLKQRAGNRWYCEAYFGELEGEKIKEYTTGFTENTPEDAAAKLAIELFKQGVLKK